MTDRDQPYRSAHYLVEPHPDVINHPIEGQIQELCTRCGAVVHDNTLHNAWHDRINR